MRFSSLLRLGLGKGRGDKPTTYAQLHNETGCALVLTHTASGLVSAAFGDPKSIGDFQLAEIQSRAFLDRVHLLDRVKLLQALDEACDARQSQSVELRFRSKGAENGGWSWLAGHVSPYQPQPDAPALARVRYENITNQKMLEGELAQTRDALDRKIAEHAEVVSQFSHQVGNSLQVIMGNAELLGHNGLNEGDRVNSILDAAQELNYFADEVRQTTHSSWQIDTTQSADFDWSTVLNEVVLKLAKTANSRDTIVEVEASTSLPDTSIELRSTKLLLSNLLKEVIAASPEKSRILVRSRQFGPKIKTEFFHDAKTLNDELLQSNFIVNSAVKKLEGELGFTFQGSRQLMTLSLPIKSKNLRAVSGQHDLMGSKTVDKKGEYRARLSA